MNILKRLFRRRGRTADLDLGGEVRFGRPGRRGDLTEHIGLFVSAESHERLLRLSRGDKSKFLRASMHLGFAVFGEDFSLIQHLDKG